MRLRASDEVALLALGLAGLVLGALPVFRVGGSCYVTLLWYCQEGVPVYVDALDRLSLYYLPLLLASSLVATATLPSLLSGRMRLHVDVKFALTLAYSFAALAVSTAVSSVKPGLHVSAVAGAVVTAEISLERELAYYIVSAEPASPLFLASIALLAYYTVEIAQTAVELGNIEEEKGRN